MAGIIDEKTKKELKGILGKLPGKVDLVFFTQQNACPMCQQQQELLETLAQLSAGKIKLEVHDLLKDAELAVQYGIDKLPATIVKGARDWGLRFFGVTAGYEFSTLLETVMMAAAGKTGLSPQLEKIVRTIDVPVHLQVMTTMTCPYCPRAVRSAFQMAMANDLIRADMVEMGEFPTVAQRYNVSGVPMTVVNETHSFEGALDAEAVYLEVLKAVKPEQYGLLEEAMREAHGYRHVRRPEEGHVYEVIIVGGGPAALSAAVYTARKDLDVLLVAQKLGGQITYTASIENYLGLPNIGGQEMAALFRNHAEFHHYAQALGHKVLSVGVSGDTFTALLDDGTSYQGHAVIYCAGKEYSRLGIPGEDRFIGRGIAFCATCDAPLYRDRRVAVVGGGNSALTAVRDLTGFATHVYLVHRGESFKADAALVGEMEKMKNVTVFTSTVVTEFLGKDRLTGARLVHLDRGEPQDLLVDGVFLEIGLNPNSEALKELITLNERGEVPVTKENATALPGLFAAGDVTDNAEKQIAIAVGDGARAALSAHRFLLERSLTRSVVGAGDTGE